MLPRTQKRQKFNSQCNHQPVELSGRGVRCMRPAARVCTVRGVPRPLAHTLPPAIWLWRRPASWHAPRRPPRAAACASRYRFR